MKGHVCDTQSPQASFTPARGHTDVDGAWGRVKQAGVLCLAPAQIQLSLSPGAETGSHVAENVGPFTPVLLLSSQAACGLK